MLGNLTGFHLIIVLAIILLLFGAPKLPALAKSIAQSMRIFKNEVRDDDKAPSDDYTRRDDARRDEYSRRDDATARPTTDGPVVRPSQGDLPPKS
ncbi:twin-arginine translocase TatA/TatE family subunit [Frigoribacterium sp. CFBP9030]|uniref:twin-arginine translocase TatA/TatE family subunit n=1 Tax=Frigoribacterium sp. CFBP9030 TaxID=3096537 RepID=UPI002A6B8A89|nr:twin-arginine translocase TatA/TatE family subunit [Frigoribacterium sp. CFBP9030]MDY0890943.1 twin-arginine translocase TatA/TatE family subunit [Frigoribacterium sp. CFBP9030]